MTLKLNARVKDFFFDREEVRKRLAKKRFNALKSAGALSRRIIRRQPRKRRRKSRPGETPSVHTDSKFATLKNVQFAYDPSSDGVVVGPIKIGGEQLEEGQTTVPEKLEYGGGTRKNALWRKMYVGGSGPIEVDQQRRTATPKWGKSREAKPVNRGKRGGTGQKSVVDQKGDERMVVFVPIETPAQAARAQRLHNEIWGPKFISANIEARPFVGPGMEIATGEFPELYAKAPAQ